MKYYYLFCFVFTILISCCLVPSAFIAVGQTTDNGAKSIILSEDFEGGVLPTGWSNDFGAATYGWLFGTDLSSAFWNIPLHTTYACANDDSCNCDMINVNLTTPSFNNSLAGAVLEFDYLSYSSSDVSEVQISIDGGINYTTLETLTGSGGAWIDDYTIDLSSYLSSDVRIRFHYSDAGGWAWGFCIDNVEISSPGGDDLAVTGISPDMAFVGDVVYPVVSIRNNGSNAASTYSVNLKITLNSTEVYNENMPFIGANLPPAADQDVNFTVPLNVLYAGVYQLKATVILANDINPANDSDTASLIAWSMPPYYHPAYAVNISNKSFNGVDLASGTLDSISPFDVTDFPMSLEFIDDILYVFRISGKVDIVYSDGTIMPVGIISGLNSAPMAATYCDLDEKTYVIGFNDTLSTLYELDIGTFNASAVGACDSGVFIAAEATQVGAIYGVNMSDDNLYTIDRLTGAATLIGSTGFSLSYGQDISWNGNTSTLYGMLYDETQGGIFGTFDTSTGSFNTISVPGDQIAAFAVNANYNSLSESNGPSVSIFPNPATDMFIVEAENLERITVYDIAGKTILDSPVAGNSSINVSEWKSGLYYVLCVVNGNPVYLKISVL